MKKVRYLKYFLLLAVVLGIGLSFLFLRKSVASTTWSSGNYIATMPTSADGAAGQEARFMGVGDLDCDGNSDDFVVTGYDNDSVVIFLSNGDGTFTTSTIAGTATDNDVQRPSFVRVADLGNATSTIPDGKPDILVGAGIANTPDIDLFWFENTCSGNFTKRNISDSSLLGVVDGRAADLDGDGDNDVLVVMRNASATRGLSWFENDQTNASSAAFSSTTENIIINDDNNSFNRTVTGDVDGDGDQDFVLAKASSAVNFLKLFKNDGNGSFTSSTVGDFNGGYYLDLADVTGDNELDIVAGEVSSVNRLVLFTNDGSENFSTSTIDAAITVNQIDVEDFDEDGDQDVLAAGLSNDTLRLYVNGGSGTFTTVTIATGATYDGAAATGFVDIDDDGALDIALGMYNAGAVYWFENDSGPIAPTSLLVNGQSAPTQITTTSPYFSAIYNDLSTGDISNKAEIQVSTSSDMGNVLWDSGESGNTITNVISGARSQDIYYNNFGTAASTSLALGDNAEGQTDVLYYWRIKFWDDAGQAGDWSSTSTFTLMDVPAAPSSLTKSAYTSNSLTVSWTDNSSIESNFYVAYAESGTSSFTTTTLAANTTSTVISGLTSGHTYVVRVYNDNTAGTSSIVSTSMVVGSGSAAEFSFTEMSFVSSTLPGTNTNATDLQAADLDGDGIYDLVASLGTTDELVWFQNDGDGSFTRYSIDSTINNAYGVQINDIDNDGDQDIFVAGGSGANIRMYLNNGSGTFTASTILTGVSNVQNLFFDDLDGDGEDDLVYTQYSSTVGIGLAWMSNGGATPFASFVTSTIDGNLDYSLTPKTGDLDGDDDVDVVNVTWSSGEIKWYANNGSGSFAASTTVTSTYRANDIEVVDLNGDGDLDIIYGTAAGENRVVYLENNGNGSAFTSAYVSTASVTGYSALSALDFDGDSDVDIIAAGVNDGTLTFFENDGAESFTTRLFDSALSYAGANRGLGLATGYFNNDSYWDAAVVNQTGNTVHLYLTSSSGQTPNTPTLITLGTRSATSLNISWTDSTLIEDEYVVGYRIYNSDSTFTTSSLAVNATSTSLTGLTANQIYEVQVYAENGTEASSALTEIFATESLTPTIYQILSTGQSLSVGYNGSPALSDTQPYFNRMLSGSNFVPLIESSVETISSPMANTLTALVTDNAFQSIVSMHGKNSSPYVSLKQGTTQYNLGLAQVTSALSAATAQGKDLRVLAVTTIHGESDHNAGTTASVYEADLVEWQTDYDTDVKAITGQTEDIPLLTDQMSSFTGYGEATSTIPIAQLAAAVNHENIYLVGPKYFLDYADQYHLTNESYRWLGEYYGKVLKTVSVDEDPWVPLGPSTVVRSGAIIYVTLNVPVEPIVIDTTDVTAATDYGFEFYDDSGSVPDISTVEVTGSTTLKITLASAPTGSDQRLRYAYTGTPDATPGRFESGSAKGNIRDSDATLSLYSNNLYNWLVHFDKSITIDETAPVPTVVAVTVGGNSSAAITWNTSEAGSTQVEYGTTNSYGSLTTESDVTSRVTTHSVNLSNLNSCTTYHYRVRSTDAVENEGISSGDTFTTAGCGGGGMIFPSVIVAPTVPAVPATTEQTAPVITNSKFKKELKSGVTNSDVSELQKFLKEQGFFKYPSITKYFGPVTVSALKNYQKKNGLQVTGNLDQKTLERINQMVGAVKNNAETITSKPSGVIFIRLLSTGSSGEDVEKLQTVLKNLGYFNYPTITGFFGAVTKEAVIKYQRANGLEPFPGWVGPGTREKLNQL